MKKFLIYIFLISFVILAWCGAKNSKTSSINENTWKWNEISSSKVFSNKLDEKEIKDEDVKKVLDEQKKVETTDINTEKELENDTKESKEIENTKKLTLSDVDLDKIQNPRDCIKIKFAKLAYKKECVKQIEDRILNWPNLSVSDCKKLVFRKSKQNCFDKVYFSLATDKHIEKYCKLIKNESIKKTCEKNILDYKKSLQKIQEQQEKEELAKKQVENVSNINECKKLSNWKTSCIVNIVKKDHDLRHCNLLTWKDKNVCINENWNESLKYNLKKALETKDKTYCDKIWNESWVKRCYNGIK